MTDVSSQVDLRIEDDAWQHISGLNAMIDKVIQTLSEATEPGEIDLLLSNDTEIKSINAQWRGKDKPTDVLSFPSDDDPGRPDFLGDIVMSIQTLERDATQMGKTLEDHFSHLLVHGYLHLLGYDHESEADAEIMETLEIKILAQLGIGDPYSPTRPN